MGAARYTEFLMTRLMLVVALALTMIVPVWAQTTVIRAARMVDVVNGRVVAPAVVVVEGERIRAVNPAAAPGDASVVELGDVTLVPGFHDMHVHILMPDGTNYRRAMVAEEAGYGLLRSLKNAEQMLMAGFTTVRELGQLQVTRVGLRRRGLRRRGMRLRLRADTLIPICRRRLCRGCSGWGRSWGWRMGWMR